jgi:rod shape determining protein RodA
MRFDRRLLTSFEWRFPLLAIAVTGLGLATVYSATHGPGATGPSPLALRQGAWFAGGVVGMLVMLVFDYRRIDRNAYLLYVLVLAALLAVPILGQVGGGSRRWLRLGPLAVQPSEFMKLALVIVLAHYFARTPGVRLGPRHLFVPLLLGGIPAAAILVQPDLGTAGMIGFVLVTMLVFGGVQLRWLALLGTPGVLLAPVLWGHLREYQQRRILIFLDPGMDPLGAGYHVNQSKIAVGSGGLWGKGFMQGTQNHLNFLPEQHTDFIFSVFAEEWGFIGTMTLMMLYLALIARGLMIAQRAGDRFGVLAASGITAIVFWQAVINVGMTTGLLPVVGITLPFFSYGGSSLLCLLLGVGLVMNVSMRRYLLVR